MMIEWYNTNYFYILFQVSVMYLSNWATSLLKYVIILVVAFHILKIVLIVCYEGYFKSFASLIFSS